MAFPAAAQLAKVTLSKEQKYEMNLKRGGPAVVTPLSKSFVTVFLDGVIEDSDGYIRYNIVKGRVGSTQKGPYINFMKLDRQMSIVSQKEVHLAPDGDGVLEPVAVLAHDGKLSLVTATAASAGQVTFASWQFDLSGFQLVKKGVEIASFPFNAKKSYSFRMAKSEDRKALGLLVLEEGSKKEPAVVHYVGFNDAFQAAWKRSIPLPFAAEQGTIAKTDLAPDGTFYALLDYTARKEEHTMSQVLVATKDRQQFIGLEHKGEPLVNCATSLSRSGDMLVAGLTIPSKKGYSQTLVLGRITPDKNLVTDKEEALTGTLTEGLDNSDERGIKKDYWVRSISERGAGTIDVVFNYCRQSSNAPVSGSSMDRYYETEVSDLMVLSYEKGKLVSRNLFKRNLRQVEQGMGHVVDRQSFSVPRVFSTGSDLYLLYLDNPNNTVGEKKKLKLADFSQASLVLSRIDGTNKVTRQSLLDFERGSGFPTFFALEVDGISEKKYFLTSDQHRVFSKEVKTASAILELN